MQPQETQASKPQSKPDKATIDHLPASELWRLLDYLRKFAPEGSSEEDADRFVLSQLPNFFEGMTLLQTAELEGICSARDERIYKDFVRDNPGIVVNLKGKAPEVKQSGWQVKSLALDLKTQKAEADLANSTFSNSDKQIIRAKTLSCLKRIKPGDYELEKQSFYFKNKGHEDVRPVFDGIASNQELLSKEFDLKAFLSVMLQYMIRNDIASYGTFSLMVFQRLDCLIKDVAENGKATEKSNIEFADKVRSIVK